MRTYDELYIDGTWVSVDGDRDVIINPATEEPIGHAPVGGKAEVTAALAAARRAFDDGSWSDLSQAERCDVVQRFVDALDTRRDEILDLIVAETGAPRGLAVLAHHGIAMDHLTWAIAAARRRPESTPLEAIRTATPAGAGTLDTGVTVREPVGVVGAITAYNYPYLLNLAKLGPALLMGNTIVLKPSPFTPLIALLMAEAADEAGIPPGVLNVITGGPEVGEILTSDDRVDLVTFTGSEKVGSAVMLQAAPTVKRVLLELGGKSALIVCEDADVDQAVLGAVFNFTAQAGQGCGALSRLLVHESIQDAFVDRAKAVLESIVVGDPAEASTTMGPLIREAQRAKVEGMVGAAVGDGATVITGGRRPEGLDRGYFYSPTLLADVAPDDMIAQEEIFGPVSIVLPFTTDDEAVAIANNSRYGLSGGVWSAEPGRAYDLARRLRTGSVRVNGGSSVEAPFGGYKRSGIGREYGEQGLDEYTETKAITFRSR